MKRTSAANLEGGSVVVGLLAAYAVLVALLAWRSRGWPLVHDAPIMHYIAWRIADGAAPYRDLFDMNFPGTYLLHLLVLKTLGAGDVAWRLFDLAWLGGASAAVAAVAAPWGVLAAAGGALFFAAYHLAGGAWQAGQRDFLVCPLLLAGALGVARWAEGRRAGAPLAWSGLALGVAITIKPHTALLAVALGAVVAGTAWRAATGVVRPVAVFAALTAIPGMAVVAWVVALGAWPAWRAIVFDYLLPLYSRLGRPAHWGFYRWHVWIPIAVAALGSLAAAAARRRLHVRHLVVVLGLAYGVVHYVGQGKGWEYHAYPAAAFAAVLVFAEIETLWSARRYVPAIPLALSVIVVAVMLGGRGVEASDAGWIAEKERRVEALVGDLGGRLHPGDQVQVLDTTDGGIHALLRLGVVEPTRFLYDFHFFHDVEQPVIRGLRAELMRDLARRPPRFIVLFRHGWPAGGEERVERFPELRARLDAAYRVVARGDGWVLYAKRDDP